MNTKFFLGFAVGFMVTAILSAAVFSALYHRLQEAQAKPTEVALVEVEKDPKLQTPPSLQTESIKINDALVNQQATYEDYSYVGEETVAAEPGSTTALTTEEASMPAPTQGTQSLTAPQQEPAPQSAPVTDTAELQQQEASLPKYKTHAQPAVDLTDKKGIVVIIDDLGENVGQSLKAIEMLPKEVVFAYLPHSKGTAEQAPQAAKLGHEIMIHFPMEPMPRKDGRTINPGPYALYTETPLTEIPKIAEKNISVLEHLAVGVNNHMGSRFTSYKEGMVEVLKVVKDKQMFFLDSLTLGKTAVEEANKEVGLPLLKRDIFLDHSQSKENIQNQLKKIETIAQLDGIAIAIGHPHQNTLEVLQAWAPTLAEKNLALIPVTQALELKGQLK